MEDTQKSISLLFLQSVQTELYQGVQTFAEDPLTLHGIIARFANVNKALC